MIENKFAINQIEIPDSARIFDNQPITTLIYAPVRSTFKQNLRGRRLPHRRPRVTILAEVTNVHREVNKPNYPHAYKKRKRSELSVGRRRGVKARGLPFNIKGPDQRRP